jgi:hypothetical protein
MLGFVKPENVFTGTINKALSFTTYNELGREIPYEDRETEEGPRIINVKKVCENAILIKIDEVFYIRIEPADNFKGYRSTMIPNIPTNEGDLFVEEQTVKPFTFSEPVDSKVVKIKGLVRKQV